MYEMIFDEQKGEMLFYNIFCLRKHLEHIDRKIKSFTYENVVEKTKRKNNATKKWLNISADTPYGVVVFNLDKCKCNLSLNEWKGKKTLQLKIKDDNNMKDVLRDCYDNTIIIDFGFDYVLVIENIPLYSYFSITDKNKYNNNYPIKEYYYEDEYVKKYLNKYKDRDDFTDLLEIKASMADKAGSISNNKVKEIKGAEKGVDYKYAPVYFKHITKKAVFCEEDAKKLLLRLEKPKINEINEIENVKSDNYITEWLEKNKDRLNEIKKLKKQGGANNKLKIFN